MRTASPSRRRGGAASRAAHGGAHAGRARRSHWVPIVAVCGILLAILIWQVVRLVLGDGTTSAPVASATNPSAASVGATTEVSIGDSGGLHVVETLAFDTPRKRIDLAVPHRVGAGEAFAPTVSALVVRGAGQVRRASPMEVGDRAAVSLERPTDHVVLEYDAAGAVQRSHDASAPERALALVTPLVVVGAESLPATVEVRSVKVLNVGCLHHGVLAGCGTRTSDGWTVETSGADGAPDVLAQLNLAVR